MGGALRVVVRFADGETVSECRGTNSLAFWVRHPKTISGDESAMRKYVVAESDFRGGDRTFVPIEYGIFVIDFRTRTLISANNYTDCSRTGIQEIRRMWQGVGAEDEDPRVVFDDLLKGGYLAVESRPYQWQGHRRVPVQPVVVELHGITSRTWDRDVYEPYSPYSRTNSCIEHQDPEPPQYDLTTVYRDWTWAHNSMGQSRSEHDAVRAEMTKLGFVLDEDDDHAYALWAFRKFEQGRWRSRRIEGYRALTRTR